MCSLEFNDTGVVRSICTPELNHHFHIDRIEFNTDVAHDRAYFYNPIHIHTEYVGFIGEEP